jgi:hypothetical protein
MEGIHPRIAGARHSEALERNCPQPDFHQCRFICRHPVDVNEQANTVDVSNRASRQRGRRYHAVIHSALALIAPVAGNRDGAARAGGQPQIIANYPERLISELEI